MSVQEQEKEGVIIAPAQRDLSELRAQLTAWLSARMPEAEGLVLTNFEYPRGAGQSHETILFDAAWRSDDAPCTQGFVVRIKPTSFRVYMDDMFAEQFEVMRVVRESGSVPVAKVFWYEESPEIVGAPFFIMEKVSGRVAVTVPSYLKEGWVVDLSTAEREKLWSNGLRTLAAMQGTPLASLSFLDRPSEGDGFMQEWNRWRRCLDAVEKKGQLPILRDFLNRLAATMPEHRPEGLTWGDARLGNMMIGNDLEVLAVMDWEQPSLGGALQDLGWWLFNDRVRIADNDGKSLSGFGSRQDTLDLWSKTSGIPTTEIDWYEAFAGFKMCCLSIHMIDMRGQDRPDLMDILPGIHTDEILSQHEKARDRK